METKNFYLCFSFLSLHLLAGPLIWETDSDITVHEALSGTEGLLKAGSGVLTLLNLNKYSGPTTIIGGGAISITNDLNLGLPEFPVTLDNAKLIIVGSFKTSRDFYLLNEGAIDTRGILTCDGSFQGSGDLVKIGASVLTLNSDRNTYSGLTIIESGVLQAGVANAFSPNSQIFINLGQSLDLNSYDNTVASLTGDGNVVLGEGVLTIAGSSDSNFLGGIFGLGGIVKSSPSVMTLLGSNSYRGETLIVDGVLRAGDDDVFSPDSTICLSAENGAILDCNGYTNTISSLSGFGKVFLGSGRLNLINSSSAIYFGDVSGTGGITLDSLDSFQLAGTNNTYSGDTLIQRGTFRAIETDAFSRNSTIVIADEGVLELNGYDNEIANLTGSGKVYINNSALAFGGNDSDANFSGSISGNGGIVKTGLGEMCFSGLNSYSGVTSIQSGKLIAGTSNAFSESSEVNFENNESAILDLGGFNNTIGGLSGGGIYGGNVHLGASTLTVREEVSTGFFGSILGSGAIIKDGSGTLILYGSNNSYLGQTLIEAGRLVAGQNNVFSPISKVEIGELGSLDLNGYSNTIGNLSGSGLCLLGSGTLITGDADSKTYSGSISGSGALVKQGLGTLTLSGTNNTYSGETRIHSGRLQAGNVNAFSQNSSVTILDGAIHLNGYDNTIANLYGESGSVILDGGSLTFGNEQESCFKGQISGTGNLIKLGKSEFKLSGVSNTYSGYTIIGNGCFSAGVDYAFSPNSSVILASDESVLDLRNHDNKIAGLEGFGVVKLSAATLSIHVDKDAEFNGSITSVPFMGRIIKTGSQTLTLSGLNNIYSGITSIKNGCIRAGFENALSPNSIISIGSHGILDLNDSCNTIPALRGDLGSKVLLGSGTLTVASDLSCATFAGSIEGSGGLIKKGSGELVLSGVNSYSGITEICDSGLLTITNESALGNSPIMTINDGILKSKGTNFTLTKDIQLLNTAKIHPENELTISGAVSGSGDFIKSGPGTLILSGSGHSYFGETRVLDGILQIEGFQIFPRNSTLNMDKDCSGIVHLNGYDNTISSLSGGGHIELGTATLTVGNDNDMIFEGVISGSGDLVKEGTGLLNLTGNHSYTGTTHIHSGTLSLNGSLQSDLIVEFGAKFRGNGIVSGNSIAYGTVAPGNSIGTITYTSPHTFATGSVLEMEMTPSDSDSIISTSTITIDPGATLKIEPLVGNYTPDTTYRLIHADGGITGTFTNTVFFPERAFGYSTYVVDGSQIENLDFTLSVLSYKAVAIGSNATNVAAILDAISLSNISSWTPELDNLFYLSNGDLNTAYNQMLPSLLKGFAIVQENAGIRVGDTISTRFQTLLDQLQCSAIHKCSTNKNPLYVWIDGFYSRLNQDSLIDDTNSQIGYHSKTGGGSIGIDYNFFDCTYIGIMGAGTSSNVHFEDGEANGNIYSGYLGVYGSIIGNGPYLNTSLLGGWNVYKAARNIKFPGVNQTAISKHDGTELLAHLDIGWNFSFKGYTLRPFESGDYILSQEDGFTEENAGILNLEVRPTNPQMYRNELGLSFAKCFNVSKRNTLIADIKLSWVFEERFNGENTVASFIDTDGLTFTSSGYFPNRSLFSPGISFTGNFCEDRAFLTILYDSEISHDYFDGIFSAQLGVKF